MQLVFNKGLRIAVLTLSLAGAAIGLWTQTPQVQADPPPPPLVVDQYIPPPAQINPAWVQALNARPNVIRYRIFELDLPAELPNHTTDFTVNLFPDLSFTTPTKHIFLKSPTHFSWFGGVLGDDFGHLGFTYNGGSIAGTGNVMGHHLEVAQLAPDVYVVAEVQAPQAGECGTD